MTDNCGIWLSSSPIGIRIAGASSFVLMAGAITSSPIEPSSLFLVMLAKLAERLVKLLVMLVTLSLRIIDCAELRIICSLRARVVIPGKGRTSRDHTSESRASSLALSPRDGASTGIRPLVARRDCDRLMVVLDEDVASFSTLVFLTTTWQSGVFGPTVVALWIDSLRATVPVTTLATLGTGNLERDNLTLFPENGTKAFHIQKQRTVEFRAS